MLSIARSKQSDRLSVFRATLHHALYHDHRHIVFSCHQPVRPSLACPGLRIVKALQPFLPAMPPPRQG